ncbi:MULTISPECIES: hypothetical protein, partial [Candidatus Accumulibacter]
SLQINSLSSIGTSPSLSFFHPLAQIAIDQEPTPIGCPIFKELPNDPLAVTALLQFLVCLSSERAHYTGVSGDVNN